MLKALPAMKDMSDFPNSVITSVDLPSLEPLSNMTAYIFPITDRMILWCIETWSTYIWSVASKSMADYKANDMIDRNCRHLHHCFVSRYTWMQHKWLYLSFEISEKCQHCRLWYDSQYRLFKLNRSAIVRSTWGISKHWRVTIALSRA